MRIANVIHVEGLLLMLLAAAMLLPVPFSLYYGDGDHVAFLLSCTVTLLVGLAGYLTTHYDRDLRNREGFAIVAFGWILYSAFGSLPYMISRGIPSFTDAFFETASGFTTTGASILGDIEALPHGVLFWRSLTHWIGGMGIIVLSLAILPFLGVGGMQLFKTEAPGHAKDRLAPRIVDIARILSGIYLLLSGALTVLLMFGGMSLFDALCHSFATISTGGFSTRNASVGAYGSRYIEYVIVVFMVLSATDFSLHYRFLKRDLAVHAKDREFLFFVSVLAVACLMVGLDVYFGHARGFEEAVRKSMFQVASISTATGFATADYDQWSFSSQFTLLMLMLFGGCAGSTAGGIKMIRVFVLIKFVFSQVIQLIHPRAVVPVRVGSSVIPRDVLMDVLGFFVLYLLTFGCGVLIMSALGLDLPAALGSAASAMGNVGPGLGSVGPTDNYSALPALAKWVLSSLMLLGRLELFTLVVLFSPTFWKK